MTDLAAFRDLIGLEHGLCVLSTLRPGGGIQSTVVNAGVLPHPSTGSDVVGLVAAGTSRRLENLRRDPTATITVRAGWQWASVEGAAELIGPDDPDPTVDSERLRQLLRDVFVAAGGTHDDWDEYDRAMADERRVVVLIDPTRAYSNPS